MDKAQLSHWIHSIPCSVQELVREDKSHMILMGFEPMTFQPSVWSINHYAVGAGYKLFQLNWQNARGEGC